jgi:hypothetical protein
MTQPIVSRKNLYHGINAHLSSILQTPGSEESPSSWHTFHTNHAAHLTDFLNRYLPERYVARLEQSLQIRTDDFDPDFRPKIRRPQPDITVYLSKGASSGSSAALGVAEPTWQADLAAILEESDEDRFMPSVVIRDVQEDARHGKAVTRIELLSPGNLPGYSGFYLYERNRLDALRSGTPVVELHYLHEFSITLADYDRLSAYHIFVHDPRPRFAEGYIYGYGFTVDAPIPVIPLPLAGEEKLDFDFNEVYHFSYEAGRWGKLVDYSQPPLRFDTYNVPDQERIRAVMARAAAAVEQT